MSKMKVYLVGGAVRDMCMGVPSNDRDFVVVGATEQDMLDRGFHNVGASFPVFLHPNTGEEYALARRERKTGPGYHGFSVEFDPTITLEEDLSRRDLTINAMAYEPHQSVIVDPYGGQDDLEAKVLRHVGTAFVEDPLRVVRLARLYARFTLFTIAPETRALCKQIVDSGEMDTLSNERYWQEMRKVFEQVGDPYRFFMALKSFGALDKVKFFVDVFGKDSVDTFISEKLDAVSDLTEDVRLKFFIALTAGPDAKQSGAAFPTDVAVVTRNLRAVRKMEATPEAVVAFINSIRGWESQPNSLFDVVCAMRCGMQAGMQFPVSTTLLMSAAGRGARIKVDEVMHLPGKEIGVWLASQRLNAVKEVMKDLE